MHFIFRIYDSNNSLQMDDHSSDSEPQPNLCIPGIGSSVKKMISSS
jgi:hypothetical protein